MPFDGASFPGPTGPYPAGRPRGGRSKETAASILIIVIAFALLATPISLTALVDVIRYFGES